MKLPAILSSLLLLLSPFPLCKPPTPSPDNVVFESGIEYGRGRAVSTCKSISRAPEERRRGRFPRSSAFTAAAFRRRQARELRQTVRHAPRNRAYVAITVTYPPRAPRSNFPAAVQDCKAAVRWLRANASKYHVDPRRASASTGGFRWRTPRAIPRCDDGA